MSDLWWLFVGAILLLLGTYIQISASSVKMDSRLTRYFLKRNKTPGEIRHNIGLISNAYGALAVAMGAVVSLGQEGSKETASTEVVATVAASTDVAPTDDISSFGIMYWVIFLVVLAAILLITLLPRASFGRRNNTDAIDLKDLKLSTLIDLHGKLLDKHRKIRVDDELERRFSGKAIVDGQMELFKSIVAEQVRKELSMKLPLRKK